MSIFQLPAGLVEVSHFVMRRVQTWGRKDDAQYREVLREKSGLSPGDGEGFEWFVFCARYTLGRGRDVPYQVPDVDNFLKPLVDAFVRLLHPDDNLHHVRGVQVEADWGPDEEEQAEIWIYAKLGQA